MIYEDYAIFTPGPVKMSPEILEIGGKQTPYFRNQAFSDVVLRSEELLLEFLNASKGSRVVFLTASGTAGMEASVMNLLNGNDNALVVTGGGFGERFAVLCESYHIKHDTLNPNMSNLENIDSQVDGSKYSAFVVNAHETSVGLLYDLEAIGKFTKKHNLFNIVDAISMFVTDEIDMQKHNIDAVIISSQKGLALPPGLTMVVLSPEAIERLNDVNSHYFNFKNYLKDGKRGQTPYTPAVSIILQLLARLEQIKKDGGIHFSIQKAQEIAEYFREEIINFPLEFYTEHMPNAMTALVSVTQHSAMDIVTDMENNYKIMVCPNGGELRDKVFRVSHMGDMSKEDIDELVEAFKEYWNLF